ncbi:MAG TPA: hypothetical protein P5525_08660, partial [Candidatus Paceibacterota bacterium]|nr:hypothetical protein [Candidatus Paceibacterota bacterium]
MTAINSEVLVQGEDDATRMQFRQPDQTGIGQGHGALPIAAHQRAQIRQLILHLQSHPQHAALQQRKERVALPAFPLQEKSGFREHRLA